MHKDKRWSFSSSLHRRYFKEVKKYIAETSKESNLMHVQQIKYSIFDNRF